MATNREHLRELIDRLAPRQVTGSTDELRLRVGDYRVRFTERPRDTLRINRVWHQSAAYK